MTRLVTRLLFIVGVSTLSSSLLAELTGSSDLSKYHPPEAPGYASRGEVVVAIGLKQVALIQQPKSLPAGVREIADVTYGIGGGLPLMLDLYLPPDKNKRPVPGLIFIHGGAWAGGTRDVYKFYTVDYAAKGYVAATVTYRLSGQAPFPAAVEDVKCAVRWMRANADQYGIDPHRIAVIGGSAGGHLAMMIGYSSGEISLEGDGGHEGVSSAVQAVVNFYGVYDMATEEGKQSSAVQRFLDGKSFDEAPNLYRKSSPRTYLDSSDPPTLIIHGVLDQTVDIEQADMLAKDLKRLKVPYLFDRLEGWPHALDIAVPANNRSRYLMDQFLKEHLSSGKQ